jgi:hypothetical protein
MQRDFIFARKIANNKAKIKNPIIVMALIMPALLDEDQEEEEQQQNQNSPITTTTPTRLRYEEDIFI